MRGERGRIDKEFDDACSLQADEVAGRESLAKTRGASEFDDEEK